MTVVFRVCPDADDGVKREFIPVPIPIPVYIPVPMCMYAQLTPMPFSLPFPVRRLKPAWITQHLKHSE